MQINLATDSPKYKRFTDDLNRVLEKILKTHTARLTDELRETFTRALEIIVFRYSSIGSDALHTRRSQLVVKNIDHELEKLFNQSAQNIRDIQRQLSKKAYLLSLAGNSEALGQANQKQVTFTVDPFALNHVTAKNLRGEDPLARILYAFNQLRRKFIQSVERCILQQLSVDEALPVFLKALPKKRVIKRPKKKLKAWKTREADKKPALPFSDGFISDQDWQEIVDDYLGKYIPTSRGPEAVFDLPDPTGGPDLEEHYAWEVEQQLTDDFVKSVRGGAIKASNDAGINDFVWIAVLDQVTCTECCQKRTGLTSLEIEEKLAKEWKDDECQAIVPPAHENCRCDIAPILKDAPPGEKFDSLDFEEWLNT